MPTNQNGKNEKPDENLPMDSEAFAQAWDSERKIYDLTTPEVHLSGTNAYINYSLKKAMDDVKGAPVTHVVTKTFEKTGNVWIAPCDAKFPGARALRLNETMTLAEFGFSIPLGKMGLKLHVTRQLDFPATPVETDIGPGWEISFSQFENYKRAVDEIAIAEAAKEKKEEAKARKRKKPQSNGEPPAEA